MSKADPGGRVEVINVYTVHTLCTVAPSQQPQCQSPYEITFKLTRSTFADCRHIQGLCSISPLTHKNAEIHPKK